MSYCIRRSTQFKRDVKRVLKRGKDLERLLDVVQTLADGEPLSAEDVAWRHAAAVGGSPRAIQAMLDRLGYWADHKKLPNKMGFLLINLWRQPLRRSFPH